MAAEYSPHFRRVHELATEALSFGLRRNKVPLLLVSHDPGHFGFGSAGLGSRPPSMRPIFNDISRPALAVTLAAILLFGLLAAGAPALADNPFDAYQTELGRQASQQGRRPAGVLPLLELWRGYPWADGEVTRGELERLAADRRLSAPRRAYAGGLLGRAQLRTGDAATAAETTRSLGYVTDFRVIGSFDDEGKRGFSAELPPETERSAPWDSSAHYTGKERQVSWRPYPAETTHFGFVNFDALFRPFESACGFAETFVEVDSARPLTLWVGNGGATKVYWNGEVVLEDEVYRQPDPDRHVATVAAHEGWNRLLVKLCVADATWGFYLRIGDATGAPAAGITVDGSAHHDVPTGPPAGVRLPRRPLRSELAALEAAASGPRARPAALEALARFLAFTGADDPVERRARQLAARAADASPTVGRLVLAASLADERGEMQRFAARAHEVAPGDREGQLLHARMIAGGPSPEDALPLLDALAGEDRVSMQAGLLRAQLLGRLEFTDAALAQAAALAERAPTAPGFLSAWAHHAESAERADETIEIRRRLVAARHDATRSRRVLALDALRRGDRRALDEQLDALAALVRDQGSADLFLSRIYEGLGENDRALEALRRARTRAPEDATVVAAEGRMLLRSGQTDAAAQSLRQALALRPQDAETRELLEQLEPEERRDEAFAIERRELLARRTDSSGYPVTILQDLTVNTVFQNGLGSNFRQYSAQAHDDQGARQLRTYSIQFDPDTQRVDIRAARVYKRGGGTLEATQTFERQLGEPWYRVYYDTRALVVVFPTIEPGDTIELQYRIDDVAHRNLFADYYGDLTYLQGFAPIVRQDYVLMTPTSREFFFSEPRLRGLVHDQTVEGETRIDHFHAENVPAIRDEQSMPGMTEIAPYLHVSTYRTWEDVGRWWWGLIQDQLVADDHLKNIVRELVSDAPDVETKVRRIHDWVVGHTRYVALEFGIHGYKPYRVPLIVQRGFGDCKDKASLLYTMFREAGIDARIVLVRTRRNGAINDLPASLSVFDHAIAYVPELDLYIDGTAEHSGTRELPEMDQGVTVLVVGPDDARLTRTPVLGPDRSRRERHVAITVEEDGAATLEVEERVIGSGAPAYRAQYAAEGTRRERFERRLRSIFPGLVLESQEMENLDDLEAPIELRYRARVPQLGRRDGGDLVVPATVLDDLTRAMARNPERRHPLDLGGTNSYFEERVVRAPRGFTIGEVPAGGEATSEFGSLSVSVEQSGREVTARTEFSITRDRISAEDYPAFRRWVERADAILGQRIHLTAGGAR